MVVGFHYITRRTTNMSDNTTLKITVPDVTKRNWKTLKEVSATFTEDELVAIVHRYCDTQDHAKTYRVRRAAKIKAVMQIAKDNGLLNDLD